MSGSHPLFPLGIAAVFVVSAWAGCLSAQQSGAAGPIELGEIGWQYSGSTFDDAKKAARESGKPMLVVFQEIPGCATCRNFGRDVLSHPLIVDAARDAFVTVAVRNNSSGDADAAVRDSYKEPAWNNPVVRILDADGEDLVPRLSGRWTVEAVAAGMGEALKGRDVPPWLDLFTMEHRARQRGLARARFSMYCFWTGEIEFGRQAGVIATTAAFDAGREVVDVVYDPTLVDFETLAQRAASRQCADTIYWSNDAERAVAERIAPSRNARLQSVSRPDRDPKHALGSTSLRFVPLMPMQALRLNTMVAARSSRAELEAHLSPAQASVWRRVDAIRKADRDAEGEAPKTQLVDVRDVAFDTAWSKVTAVLTRRG